MQVKNTATAIGAFHATRKSSDQAVTAGTNVVFDHVTYNPTNASDYDAVSGAYVCPLSGTYLFHISIHCVTPTAVQLRKSGVEQMQMYSGGNDYPAGSSSAIIHCNAQEVVNVVADRDGNIRGNNWSNFCGFLLHADPL
jgi:hypothetical protein